jgi:hypothetical protein
MLERYLLDGAVRKASRSTWNGRSTISGQRGGKVDVTQQREHALGNCELALTPRRR